MPQIDKITALSLLRSSSANDRLIGARFLARSATPEDIGDIDIAIRNENVSWVRNALTAALVRATISWDKSPELPEGTASDDELSLTDSQVQQIYSSALQESTSVLLHEVEPLVGMARLYAKREIQDFEQSRTKAQFEQLDSLLHAIADLRKASSPAKLTEVDLPTLIRELLDRETADHKAVIQLAGPAPFNVLADRGRLLLTLGNGLRNALEANDAVDEPLRRPLVINWNKTEKDFWVSILDHGTGLKGSIERIFEIGSTSKAGHQGMGLAVARQAMLSMDGDITISPREESGVKFEIRWRRYATSTP